MTNFFDLIHELGEFLGEELKADPNQSITLGINETLKVQIELDPTGEKILLSSMITELPPGKFRENILKDGLKANFLAEDKIGILSYLEKENTLVLFHYLESHAITKEILHGALMLFIERATKWLSAIEAGRSSPEMGEIPEGTEKKGAMFGFK